MGMTRHECRKFIEVSSTANEVALATRDTIELEKNKVKASDRAN
jgi:hypothetical protein